LINFHFSLGNSTKGSIGFCTRVLATTKENAVEILRECLPQEVEMADCGRTEIGYLNIYFNGDAISTKDIDEQDTVGVGELSSAQVKMLNINLETVG
jgi:hypothetical protein